MPRLPTVLPQIQRCSSLIRLFHGDAGHHNHEHQRVPQTLTSADSRTFFISEHLAFFSIQFFTYESAFPFRIVPTAFSSGWWHTQKCPGESSLGSGAVFLHSSVA